MPSTKLQQTKTWTNLDEPGPNTRHTPYGCRDFFLPAAFFRIICPRLHRPWLFPVCDSSVVAAKPTCGNGRLAIRPETF